MSHDPMDLHCHLWGYNIVLFPYPSHSSLSHCPPLNFLSFLSLPLCIKGRTMGNVQNCNSFNTRLDTLPGLEIWEYGRGDPLRSPRDTLYPQKLAPTSLTSGGRSVGIVRSLDMPRYKDRECSLSHPNRLIVRETLAVEAYNVWMPDTIVSDCSIKLF
jgi:hypothetical protein